jgi:AcrR family transcriptional regulator
LDRFSRNVNFITMIQKDEIRETILNVAREIFSRFGFHKTTMEDIARATGKGKSSIYYYYKNKEEIFRAVVDKEVLGLIAKILVAINNETDPREKLKAYVMERMRGFDNFLNLYSVLKTEFLSHFDFAEQIRKKYDKEEINIIKRILDEGVVNNEFNIEDTYLTSVAIVTAMKGLEIPLFITHIGENHLEARLDQLIDVLFFGIIKR